MNESWDTHFGSTVFLKSRETPWYSDLEDTSDDLSVKSSKPTKQTKPTKSATPTPEKTEKTGKTITEHFESKKELLTILILALIIAGIIRYFIFI